MKERTELFNDFVAYVREHHGQDVSGLVRAYLLNTRAPGKEEASKAEPPKKL